MTVESVAVPLDAASVAAWLRAVGVSVEQPLVATLMVGGRSNLTFLIEDASARRFVLRRPPLGAEAASTHDVGRERRILAALAATDVPVPAVIAHCTDDDVIGAPFYVMEYVRGTALASSADAEALSPRHRHPLSVRVIEMLAALHDIVPDAVGLGDLGRPDDYLGRQLRRWNAQNERSLHGETSALVALHRQLVERTPPQRYTGLLHGDFRLGNMLITDDGTINAVVDWELSTRGDQLVDLAWLLFSWVEPGERSIDPVRPPSTVDGFATRAELIDRYAEVTGRDVSDLPYYMAFSSWRAASIAVGIRERYRSGAMGDVESDIDQTDTMIAALAEQAHAALEDLV